MKRALTALTLLAAAAPAAASPWAVVPAQSRIGFTATWLGKPVEGSFSRWNAAIDFDPTKPAAAKIVVDIDTRSAVTGDRTVDGALPGEDWFGPARTATARFVATSVTQSGPGAYVARGTLTLKGKSVAVALPFSVRIAGDVATVAAALTLDRRALGLGLGADATAAYVAFAVPVRIAVVARRR